MGMFIKTLTQITSQANVSMVSKGKFVFDNEGTNVHNNRCKLKQIEYLFIFF